MERWDVRQPWGPVVIHAIEKTLEGKPVKIDWPHLRKYSIENPMPTSTNLYISPNKIEDLEQEVKDLREKAAKEKIMNLRVLKDEKTKIE